MLKPVWPKMGLIVVTGAAGLVGGNLVRILLAEGQEVRALVHRDRRALVGLDVEIVNGDVAELDSLIRAFAGAEVVYHTAGSISLRMDSWDELARVNITGTRNVVRACLRCGVRRLLHFSSVEALRQEPLDQPLDENRSPLADPAAPPYVRSKAAADQIVQEGIGQGLDTVVVYPTAIVGPMDFRPSYFAQSLLKLVHGTIPVLVEGGYDWVDVRDVVAGAIQAERLAPSGRRYILSGEWHSLSEVARMVEMINGRPAPRLVLPLWMAELGEPFMVHFARFNGSEPLYTRAMLNALRSNRRVDHSRATQDLGYSPRPFQETLRDTLHWLTELPVTA
jgi:dihydroflavonol-4-reductase